MLLREFFNNIQLQELFDFSYPYRLVVDNYYLSFDYWEKKYEADTKIGKLHVLFMIKKTIIIEFSIEGAYDITGLANGEQFKILSTVWKIISNELPKFIDDTINSIKFTAEHDEPSRVSLYRKVVPKITALLGSEWRDSEDEDEDSVIFLWQRSQSTNQTLIELFNFSYAFDSKIEKKDDNLTKYRYIANTPLGELIVTITQVSYLDFENETVKVLIIQFTVNDQDELTGQANQGEQFKILSTVWRIVSTKLPKLIDDDTASITFAADIEEPSRISLYKKMVPKVSNLLGSKWEFKSYSENSEMYFRWDQIFPEFNKEYYNY